MERISIEKAASSFTCDLRKVNKKWVQYIKERDRTAWEIVRYGRIDGLREMLAEIVEAAKVNRCHGFSREMVITIDGQNKTKVNVKAFAGATKAVAIINGVLAVKVTYDKKDFGNQTAAEFVSYELYRNSGDECERRAAERLAPCLRYFPCRKGEDGKYQNWSGILLQVATENVCSFDEAIKETRNEEVTETDMVRAGMRDMHDANCGVLNGVPVVIDYGLNRKIQKWAVEQNVKL